MGLQLCYPKQKLNDENRFTKQEIHPFFNLLYIFFTCTIREVLITAALNKVSRSKGK